MCTIPLNYTTARWLLGPCGERSALCVTDYVPPLVLVYSYTCRRGTEPKTATDGK